MATRFETDALDAARRRTREVVVIIIAISMAMVLLAMIPLVWGQAQEIKRLRAELGDALERVTMLTNLLREASARAVPRSTPSTRTHDVPSATTKPTPRAPPRAGPDSTQSP